MGGQAREGRVCARRTRGRVGVAAALLALACNQLTGVSSLKVARCDADAGPDAGTCQTELGTLSAADAGSTGGAGGPEQGGIGGGAALSEGGPSGARVTDIEEPPVPSSGCEPGTIVQCLGPGSCSGTQTCLEDGASLSRCECGPAAVATAGSIGANCAGDEDCAPGLGCTTPQATSGPFLGGGVQGGFCSRRCAGDADCVGADPGAICVSHATGPAFCFPECSPRLPSFPEQCNGRSDLICLPLTNSQRGYCAPACQSDADCAPRACNLATGLCADSVSDGAAIGGACSADSDCEAGLCLRLPGQPPACTGLCTLGSIAGCGFGADERERSAACTNEGAASLGLGLGVGLCQELCDVDEDCLQASSSWSCAPWDEELGYEERFNSVGFCQPPSAGGGAPGCNDSCVFAFDGVCDDEGAFPLCDPGTDCSDCGPR